MSDQVQASTAATTSAPVTATPDAVRHDTQPTPTISDVPAPVAPSAADAAQKQPSESLEKLLEHISSLQQSNADLNMAIEEVRKGNLEKLKANMETQIKPWIDKLDINEEYKKSFLEGVEHACAQTKNKTVSDFETNPVYTVVCSAAAMHGQAISDLEKTRAELAMTKEQVNQTSADTSRMIEDKTNALLYSSNTANDRKRKHTDVQPDVLDNDANGSLWAGIAATMRKENGRF